MVNANITMKAAMAGRYTIAINEVPVAFKFKDCLVIVLLIPEKSLKMPLHCP